MTFELGVAGTGVWVSIFSPRFPQRPFPLEFDYPFAWSGVVTVTTISGADGTYFAEARNILTASGHINSEPPLLAVVPGVPGGDPAGLKDLAGFALFDFPGDPSWIFPNGASVTIVNGAVSSISASGIQPGSRAGPATLTFSGLGVSYTDAELVNSAFGDGFRINAQGVLTPVPEPETWALMLAGIAGIGAVTRMRRSQPVTSSRA